MVVNEIPPYVSCRKSMHAFCVVCIQKSLICVHMLCVCVFHFCVNRSSTGVKDFCRLLFITEKYISSRGYLWYWYTSINQIQCGITLLSKETQYLFGSESKNILTH